MSLEINLTTYYLFRHSSCHELPRGVITQNSLRGVMFHGKRVTVIRPPVFL